MSASDQIEQVLAARASIPEHVVFRSFESETLLLNLESGQYHGLNATGGRFLELLGEESTQGSVSAAVAQLARECVMEPREIESEMAAFCLELEQRGLVEVARDGGNGAGG